MNTKILVNSIIIIIIALVIYGVYQYFKPNRDTAWLTTEIEISAAELFKNYSADEKKSDTLYKSKVIEVKGKIMEIKNDTSGALIYLDANEMFGISCRMQNKKPIKSDYKPGDEIIVKGICNGLLADVILTRCIIVKN